MATAEEKDRAIAYLSSLDIDSDSHDLIKIVLLIVGMSGKPWSRPSDIRRMLETAAAADKELEAWLGDQSWNLAHLETIVDIVESPYRGFRSILNPKALFFFSPRFLLMLQELAEDALKDQAASDLLHFFLPHEPKRKRGRDRISYSERQARERVLDADWRAGLLVDALNRNDAEHLRRWERNQPQDAGIVAQLRKVDRSLLTSAERPVHFAIVEAMITGELKHFDDLQKWNPEPTRCTVRNARETADRHRIDPDV